MTAASLGGQDGKVGSLSLSWAVQVRSVDVRLAHIAYVDMLRIRTADFYTIDLYAKNLADVRGRTEFAVTQLMPCKDGRTLLLLQMGDHRRNPTMEGHELILRDGERETLVWRSTHGSASTVVTQSDTRGRRQVLARLPWGAATATLTDTEIILASDNKPGEPVTILALRRPGAVARTSPSGR